MHDLDRVRLETHANHEMSVSGPFEAESFQFGEAEAPWQEQSGEVFNETEQMELAAEMLGITSEAELDRFLGDFIKRAGQATSRRWRSPKWLRRIISSPESFRGCNAAVMCKSPRL